MEKESQRVFVGIGVWLLVISPLYAFVAQEMGCVGSFHTEWFNTMRLPWYVPMLLCFSGGLRSVFFVALLFHGAGSDAHLSNIFEPDVYSREAHSVMYEHFDTLNCIVHMARVALS